MKMLVSWSAQALKSLEASGTIISLMNWEKGKYQIVANIAAKTFSKKRQECLFAEDRDMKNTLIGILEW